MSEFDIEIAAKWVDVIFLEKMLIPGDMKRKLRTEFIEGLRSGNIPLRPETHIETARNPQELLAHLLNQQNQQENADTSTVRYPRLSSLDNHTV